MHVHLLSSSPCRRGDIPPFLSLLREFPLRKEISPVFSLPSASSRAHDRDPLLFLPNGTDEEFFFLFSLPRAAIRRFFFPMVGDRGVKLSGRKASADRDARAFLLFLFFFGPFFVLDFPFPSLVFEAIREFAACLCVGDGDGQRTFLFFPYRVVVFFFPLRYRRLFFFLMQGQGPISRARDAGPFSLSLNSPVPLFVVKRPDFFKWRAGTRSRSTGAESLTSFSRRHKRVET